MAFIQAVICSVEHAMTGMKQAFAKGPGKHGVGRHSSGPGTFPHALFGPLDNAEFLLSHL